MNKYNLRPREIEAVQLTEEMVDGITALPEGIKHYGVTGRFVAVVPEMGCMSTADVGAWVIYENGHMRFCKNNPFVEKYQLVI